MVVVLSHRLRGFVWAITVLVSLSLFAILYADTVAAIWKANRVNVNNLGHLMLMELPNRNVLETMAVDSCVEYSTTIALLRTAEFRGLPPEQQLQLLNQMVSCQRPERRSLLTPWVVVTKWNMARHGEVCERLLALNAPHRLVELAQDSLTKGDWESVEAALECVQRFPPDGAWVSPFIVSQLYYSLGQHFEDADEIAKALGAYDAAARWYPVVWSAPYTRKAALLWRSGAQAEAVDWLVDGLVRSTDVTATFYLWRELGKYWQQQGNLNDAACAYRNAAALANHVPPQNVTPRELDQLRAELSALGTPPATACFRGYPQLQVNQPGE
ncbi:MAG: hypothetical protein RMN53_05020 [Anaerolineae bacterium]|nr:hypothetical protein [Anaerolineae bacterium]